VRRLALPLLALAAVCAAGALPALAADQTVSTRGQRFTPAVLALRPGETLTIVNDDPGVAHSLQFTDEPQPRRDHEVGWTERRTFTAAEARAEPYVFYCAIHYRMTARVYVNESGTVPTPTATPTATPVPTTRVTPVPSVSPTPSPGVPPTPSPVPEAAATLRSLKLRHAGRRGVSFRIELATPASVRAVLRRRAPGARRFKRVARVRFGTVPAGERRLRIQRHLRPGRYRLRVTAAGTTRTLRFRVSDA
jgi:plastocyanin